MASSHWESITGDVNCCCVGEDLVNFPALNDIFILKSFLFQIDYSIYEKAKNEAKRIKKLVDLRSVFVLFRKENISPCGSHLLSIRFILGKRN